VDDELRTMLGETDIKIVKSIGYYNAGIMEFLVDKDKNFWHPSKLFYT